MPSEECVAYYREQYEFTGDMLVTGYPRCDALVNDDASVVRRTRARAPRGRRGPDRGALRPDVPRQAEHPHLRRPPLRRPRARPARPTARPGHTLLVRGHNNNQRELDRVTGMAQVVDVTDYPDINELTLAADVAVLDYSSLRFDWAITGKPMVFFVPDLEDYFALRRPLFPYEGTAPGPWTNTTEEVAAALARRRRPAVAVLRGDRAVQQAVQRAARRARHRPGDRGVLHRPGDRVSDSPAVTPIPEGSVLLHIGPQKTGSTAIQESLHNAREQLAELGVYYPGPYRRPIEAGWAVLGHRRPARSPRAAHRDLGRAHRGAARQHPAPAHPEQRGPLPRQRRRRRADRHATWAPTTSSCCTSPAATTSCCRRTGRSGSRPG